MATTATPDPTLAPDLDLRVAELCHSLPEGADAAALLDAIRALVPGHAVSLALTRGGWHRLGGILDIDYGRVSEHLADWARAESGGNLDTLMLKVADLRYFATRINGQTHYFTIPTGPGARDFIQIEIEQVQEVLDRCLTDPDWYPDSIEEFIDPLDFPRLESEPIGSSRLVFRRLVRVADLLASPDAGPRLVRFFDDWDRSSAGEEPLCEHWVLGIREYRDSDGDDHLSARPIAIPTGEIPVLADDEIARGAKLANRIHTFDRAVGYPFAWYFHMLTNPKVSHQLAEAVHGDQMGAYDYLPPKDLKVLRDWYDAPYGA